MGGIKGGNWDEVKIESVLFYWLKGVFLWFCFFFVEWEDKFVDIFSLLLLRMYNLVF